MNLFNKIPGYILYVLNELGQQSYKSYLVGGCVRDLLLYREPKDYDITTSALPEQVKSIFPHVVLTGEKHGTVTVVTDQGNVEVTTMRHDGVYKDCRRPETVEFTDDIVQDLSRRDFTINAIAVDTTGKIVDPFNGLEFLHRGCIQTVGSADDRFNEDALRLVRAARIACQLNFMIEGNVVHSILKNRTLIKNVSIERIRDELCKILTSNRPSWGIELLRITRLLDLILPEVSNMIDFDQHNPNHHKDVYEHTLLVLDNVSNNLILRLAALLHDIGKPISFTLGEDGTGHFYRHHMIGMDMTKEILQRMKFDNKIIDTVSLLVKEHMSRYDFLRTPNIKRFINRIGIDNLNGLFELQIADIKASKPPHNINGVLKLKKDVEKVLKEKQPLKVKDLKINGYDLIALGMKPGKEMGLLLNELLELVLESPELNDKDYLINYVKEKNNGL